MRTSNGPVVPGYCPARSVLQEDHKPLNTNAVQNRDFVLTIRRTQHRGELSVTFDVTYGKGNSIVRSDTVMLLVSESPLAKAGLKLLGSLAEKVMTADSPNIRKIKEAYDARADRCIITDDVCPVFNVLVLQTVLKDALL